ncbi:MAG: hypothetical protein NXH78_01400 [Hyphomonadaceae bacterium]|nr:hypothetical protein [Hyphomonadaceae bacterium]
MTIFKDIWVWFNAMGTLPWTIRLWATCYPLPQIIGGLIFIQTLPGAIIFGGRILSGIIASQIHKRSPFSKLMGPVGHAHWALILPYLIYELATQDLAAPLFWFISYVVATTLISGIIDVIELRTYFRKGHVEYKR